MSESAKNGKAPAERWSKVAARAVADRDLLDSDTRVLGALGIFANPEGLAWPSQELLAMVTGFRRETVCRAIQRLLAAEYLERFKKRTRRGHFRNVYRLLYPPYNPPRLPTPEL